METLSSAVRIATGAISIEVVVALMLALGLISITTRYLSGHEAKNVGDRKDVPLIPYWIPYIGHVIELARGRLLEQAAMLHSIYAIKLGPFRLNVVSHPALVNSIMQQREQALSLRDLAWTMSVRVFGIPSSAKAQYFTYWDTLNSPIAALMREPELSRALGVTISFLEQRIPSMISFAPSHVDQELWERASNCTVDAENPATAEVDLFALVRHFLGHASVPSFIGQAFHNNNPTILHDLFAMDQGFGWLASGLPRWVPIPGLLKAHIARKRVMDAMAEFYAAYDNYLDGGPPDSRWGSFEDVGSVLKHRVELWRELDFPPHQRGDIAILWALVANANSAVFWMLLSILADADLCRHIRTEITPFVHVSHTESINGFVAAPTLSFDGVGLAKECPLLKAAFYETNRLCSKPWSARLAGQDVVITVKDRDGQVNDSYRIRAGEYVAVPHEYHMLDAQYFAEPLTFKPERFIDIDADGRTVVNMRTIRPFGGGHSQCKGRTFAERECMCLVAGILMLWDIEPLETKDWVIPPQVKTTAISLPKHDVRVRIRRRP